jgi:His/Glu/Gln/Arg/opine family amino acid ABC transporter permease subunit
MPTPVFAFEWILIWQHKSQFFYGLEFAIKMAALGLVLSAVLGLLLALARMRGGVLGFFAALYINIFRGMPALVTVLWVYFGVSLFLGINFSVYESGVISLTLLYSAFISEIYRAALLSIHRGQREAGLALGMRPHRVFLKVVLPQATKIAVPNLGSMLIGMLKDTSTFSFVGASEIIFHVQNLEQTYYQPFPLYTAAAAVYVFSAFVIDYLFRNIELALTVPPSSGVSGIWGRRRRRQITAITERVQGATGT